MYQTNQNYYDIQPSSWKDFPSDEDRESRYKFVSVTVKLSKNSLKTNRQTYSLLDWIGDIGGLYDGLKVIGFLLSRPIGYYKMNAKLASLLVRYSRPLSYEQQDELN